ncbi:MAG: ABC transporter permease [Gemmatimonadota bacterium]
MNWHDVWILYRRELRSAMRERTIVVNGILMPIFLYPVMLWVILTGITFVSGLQERAASRVAVLDPPPAHPALMDTLAAREDIDLRPTPVAADEAIRLIREEELDALVEFLPAAPSAAALQGNFTVHIRYDRAVERSRRARDRVDAVISDYRDEWMAREAETLGIADVDRQQFLVVQRNTSSGEQMGALVLGMLIPLFLVIMVALGCFIPSIDSTAGERERSTWETLMTVSASRLSIVTAKYLYVATLGILAGLLNVVAMFVSLGAVMAPLLGGSGEGGATFEFTIQPLAVPVMMVAAIALALFFAAAMMLLAAFARSFKDGQAMVMPIYWLAILPIILGQQTDQTLTPTIAAIPVANAAMMIRDAINGVFLWPLMAETMVVLLLMVAACLLLARTVLKFEDFLMDSFDGSLWRLARDRLLGARGATGGRPGGTAPARAD